MPNLTLLLVYSWPGYNESVSEDTNQRFWFSCPYVDLGVIRQRSKSLVQSLVHLLRIAFEETTTTYCFVSSLFVPTLSPRDLPPMKRVSPVKTTFSLPSSNKKQTLSWV
jgi:hypothetical protein